MFGEGDSWTAGARKNNLARRFVCDLYVHRWGMALCGACEIFSIPKIISCNSRLKYSCSKSLHNAVGSFASPRQKKKRKKKPRYGREGEGGAVNRP